MKKDEKIGSAGRRTILTRSTAALSTKQETPGLRRSNRGTPSKNPVAPASSTRRSERLASSPASVTEKSVRMEKKNTASPLQRSDKGKNVSVSENSKGSDKSGRNAETSSDIEESKDMMLDNIEESTNKVKEREPKMTARSYRAMFSRRIRAGNDDALKGNANSESKRLPVGGIKLEKGTDSPLKLIKDTEKLGLDASPIVETGDDSLKGSPSKNSETQELLVCKNSLETDSDLPLKRKRDTAEIVLDARPIVANADDHVMSFDVPSPSGCEDNDQPEICSTCLKRQKVNGDFENLSVCICNAQPVQEPNQVVQDMEKTGPATSRDHGENRQTMQQDKSHDPKLSSMYQEFWVPVQLSEVQLEQYCRTLFSKSLSLSSLSRTDLVGALEETLTSVRKTCDHPYVTDVCLKPLLTKNLELQKILDVEVKASGKLHLLDAMLTQIKKNGLKAVVFYQATQSPGGLMLGNILEDFMSQRFGQNSYEHGVVTAKKNAINNFNKESQCFVLLLETRACSHSIKLLRAEAFILFGSNLNPSQDVKLLEKIKIESYSERTKVFRLYSTCTVEEKSLNLARQNKPIENLNRSLIHALLMWGASYLFDKLDHFHGSETPDSGVPCEQSIMDSVIHEFSSILSSKVGEENEAKLCLLLEAKHDQGTYSTDSTLLGEEHVKLSDEESPNIFWTKLFQGRNPMWKYCSDTPQRGRKRIQYFQGYEETATIDNGGNKKRKKASDDVTLDNNERKASGKDHTGALETPIVIALQSTRRSAAGTNGTLNGNDAVSLISVGSQIFRIPKDMLAGIDRRQILRESQKTLHAILKPEMAKLGKVLHLSEGSTSMVEKFLGYVIENHRVCKEPATTLQAFQIALSWIATSFAEQKLNRGESLACAKSELAFNCCREEVDFIYSMLCCMKSLFLERTQGLQLNCFGTNSKQSTVSKEQVNESLSGATVRLEKNDVKLMRSSEGEDCMTEKRGGHNSSAAEDIEKALSYIKKKCKKRLQNLKEKHEEKKLELVNTYADKKQKLENEKKVEGAIIRIQCKWTSAQSLEDGLKRLDHDHEKKIDEITSVRDEGLKSLEQTHEAEKKKLAEDEACWISRVEKWAQAELINCAPIKSASNKHFSGICSPNTSKNAPDVQTCNDASREATYADTNCMVSKGDQVPEAENTLGTMSGGSTQQVHEMEASRNDKAMDISTLSGEKLTDNAATKILIPAGCQVEFPTLNVHLSKHQIYDKMTSVAPDEVVPSRVPEISKSFANLVKSASPEISLNREEAMVTIENNRTSDVGSDSDNILDQQNEQACSLEKDIPDELVLPMHPASVVETRDSAESDQDDQDICSMPPSPAGKQPDPAANIQGQNKEAGIEPQQAGSRMPSSPAGQQPDQAANIQGQNKEAAIESQSAESLIPSSLAGQLLDPVANYQGQTNESAIEPQPAGSPIPSSPAGQQPDQAANNQGQTIEAATEPQPAGSPIPSSPAAGQQPDQAANNQRQTIDAATEPQPAGSPIPSSPAGQQPDQAENIQGQNIEAAIESQSAGSLMPSSPAGQLLDPVANNQGQTIEVAIEAQSAGSLMPSSPARQLLDPVANNQGQTIEAAIEPQPSGSETIETGGFSALEQADQVACPLPSSPTGNQPGPAANIEGQNINTSAELHIAGLGAVELGDSPVSDQEKTGPQYACSLPSSLVGTQADLAANTEGQNITRVAQLHTAGSDAVEIGGSAVSNQGAQDASHVPFSSPGNPTTESNACEMEIAEPGPQVEQSTFANNVAQLVGIGGVEPSASVTAPVRSLLLNNGAGQSAVQPVPQVPFPMYTDPFQYELEKLRRESENVKKTFEEKTSILKAELERKLAEVQAEYQRRFHEVEAEKNARETEVETKKNTVIMNKLLGNAFLSKCTTKIASHPSEAPRGRIQQLAQRAALVGALRNYTASAPARAPALPPAPLQRQASALPCSLPPPSGLPLNPAVCPMPPPRQTLISSTAPSSSASPATYLTANARPPHPNSYRSSSSLPIPTTTSTSLPLPHALSYATMLIQHQQQQQQQQQQRQQSLGNGLQQLQQNLGSGLQQQHQHQQQQHQQSLGSGLQQLQQNLVSGLQGRNRNDDVVCLSDDE